MWKFIKSLFVREKINVKELLSNGGTILDVRTVAEFEEGHVEGSINIPLDQLMSALPKINKLKQPIIACCRTGRRSGMAAIQLKKKGLDVYNGGGWKAVASQLK
jgi:rhodanese-related sulfurtransferase